MNLGEATTFKGCHPSTQQLKANPGCNIQERCIHLDPGLPDMVSVQVGIQNWPSRYPALAGIPVNNCTIQLLQQHRQTAESAAANTAVNAAPHGHVNLYSANTLLLPALQSGFPIRSELKCCNSLLVFVYQGGNRWAESKSS